MAFQWVDTDSQLGPILRKHRMYFGPKGPDTIMSRNEVPKSIVQMVFEPEVLPDRVFGSKRPQRHEDPTNHVFWNTPSPGL